MMTMTMAAAVASAACARSPAHWAQRGRARGGLASSACDILATLGSDMLRVRLSSQFRLRHPRNSGFRNDAREVVQSVLPEISSQLWAPICPDLRWPGQFRVRRPRNSGLQYALTGGGPTWSDRSFRDIVRCRARDGLASFARDILATLGSEMVRARWSIQLRLMYPRNSGLRCPDVRWSSQVRLRHAAHEVIQPVSPEISSQLWVRRCCERGCPASSA